MRSKVRLLNIQNKQMGVGKLMNWRNKWMAWIKAYMGVMT